MKALIIKNLQNDFLSMGALPLENAESFIEKVNTAMKDFKVVIAIQKWFPADHHTFAANHPWRKPGQTITIDEKEIKLQVINCVADSYGAAFPAGLNQEKINYIIKHEGNSSDTILEEINRIIKEYNIVEIEVMGPGESPNINQ